MKKIILCTLLLMIMGNDVMAHDFEVDGIYYAITSLSEPLTVAVSYKGSTYNYYSNEYKRSVSIPETVTYKGNIYSVTSIGEHAFANCTGLTSVTIPNSVTSIGIYSFFGCTSLASVTIPNSVDSIPDGAFAGCKGLTSIIIPESINSIGNSAFDSCTSLTSVTIPNSVTSINNETFRNCSSLTSVTIPNGAISIGFLAFERCVCLTSVIIPNTVTSIGESAFSGCTSLTSVTIPNSVTTIDSSVFKNCSSLTSIIIPNAIASIGESAFSGCNSLDSVTINSNAIASKSYNGSSTLATLFGSQVKHYIFGEGVESIGEYACRNCKDLSSVTILKSVNMIGRNAFQNCSRLTTVKINSNAIASARYSISSTLANIFGSQVKDYSFGEGVERIGEYACYKCSGLTSVSILSSVAEIGFKAFYDCTALTKVEFSSLESLCKIEFRLIESNPLYYAHHLYIDKKEVTDLVIPNSVTSIGAYAFSGCNALKSVTIPESVTSIGGNAFYDCSGLTKAEFASLESLCKIEFEFSLSNPLYYAHHLYIKGEEITDLVIPNSVTSIGACAFNGCSAMTSITIPESVTSIGDCAFYECSGLTSVIIPNSVTTIGFTAFRGCRSLSIISIPNSVTEIRGQSFFGCSGLTTVAIPNSVNTIESQAFWDCTGLTSITIPDCVTSIGEYTFSGCTSLTSVTIGTGVTLIDNYAFNNCRSLTSVKINSNAIASAKYSSSSSLANIFGSQVEDYSFGEGVESIGDNACYNCVHLKSVTIGNGVTSIGGSAFWGCSSLIKAEFASIESLCRMAFGSYGANPLSYAHHLYINGEEVMDLVIPNSVTSIGGSAFQGCHGLTSVSIPNSVTSIGVAAFSDCSGLIKADFSSVESLCRITFDSYDENPLFYAHHLYINGEEVTDLVIPNCVTSIGNFTFNGCSGLTSVSIPESVNSIGEAAFGSCTGLTSITIPNSVTFIGGAFSGCTGLTSISIPNSVTSISHWAFEGCTALASVTIPNSVTSIDEWAFAGCCSLTSVSIPNSVTSIGDNAFIGCTGLASVKINSNTITSKTYNTSYTLANIFGSQVEEYVFGEGVESIGDNACYNCEQLKSVAIDNNVTYIRMAAFSGCTALTSIAIPESVKSIGEAAFLGCTALKSVTINSASVVGQDGELSDIFGNQVTSYVVGDKATSIGDNVFGDTSHKSVILPNNIRSIGNAAFGTNTTIKVERGCKTLLALWNSGNVEPIDVATAQILSPSKLSFINSTQTTATFVVDNIYPEYTIIYDGTELKGSLIQLTGLRPEMSGSFCLIMTLGNLYHSISADYITKSLELKINPTLNPTSIIAKGSYTKGDAKVISQKMAFMDVEANGNVCSADGLEPAKEYAVKYVVSVSYGDKDIKKWDYEIIQPFKTNEIQFNTLSPKVISKDEVIVAAESNITNDEEKVGFEWRRTDAPDEVASKSGEAFLYEGTMEGYIHNLSSSNYWRYRPYYLSASGQKFYGAWGIIEADDYSYFEPTVHTYAKIQVDGNTAEVKGYATRGSDEVTEQGFMYWTATNNVKAAVSSEDPRRAPSIPVNAKTIAATGQVMTAQLTGLDYEQKYCYVAYMKTDTGKIYYGEQQSFMTGEVPVSVGSIRNDYANVANVYLKARYDLQGRKIAKAVKGVNILRMSDGSTKKVFVE